MNRLLKPGQALYAMALVALGVTQYVVGMFVVGRSPTWNWASSSLVTAWAYLSGAVLIGAGVAIFANRKGREAACLIGLMLLLAPVIRFIPVIAADKNFGGDWTNFFKSLALAGGSFIVANSIPANPGDSRSLLSGLANQLAPLGRFAIALFFLCAGIQHYLFDGFVKTLVPAWIPPGQLFWTYFAGVALFSAGVGLLLKKTVYWAALLSGIMIFTWMIILHFPRAIASPHDTNEWLGCIETMAFSGILFVLAARSSRS